MATWLMTVVRRFKMRERRWIPDLWERQRHREITRVRLPHGAAPPTDASEAAEGTATQPDGPIGG